MPRRASPFGLLSSAVASTLLVAVAVGLNSPAQAECITQLNQQAPEGAHWSLHSDPVKNRRCWILVDASGHELSPSPEPAPAPTATSTTTSSIQKFFSNLTASITGPLPPPQDPPAAAPPHRPPPRRVVDVNRSADQKSDPTRHEMTPEDRDALFEEFLRWHESQTGTPKQPPQ